MLICWDLAFPEAFRELIAQGAKIMYVARLLSIQRSDVIPSKSLYGAHCIDRIPNDDCNSIIPTFWKLDDCNEAGLRQNPAAEALFLDSMLTARAFENTCGMRVWTFFFPSFFLR